MLTLLDGNPANNFLKRAATFNPNGVLNGARRITIAGTYAYILCDRGLVVVNIENPLEPKVESEIGAPDLVDPQGVAIQFRYAFVVDKQGLKVLDVTSLAHPRVVPGATVPLEDARNIYVARTYAYVAGGKQGLVIVDVERPEHPRIDQVFNAEGELNDTRDVKLSMTAASAFAYLADGKNGFRIVQLFAPNEHAELPGLQSEADAEADRDVSHQRCRRWRCRRGSIAIARWMRAATRSRCSTGAARGRSITKRPSGCICATAGCTR